MVVFRHFSTFLDGLQSVVLLREETHKTGNGRRGLLPMREVFSQHVPGATAFLLLLLASVTGCFQERSFKMHVSNVVHVSPDTAEQTPSTRAWLRSAHNQLKHLLPRTWKTSLLTEDMVDRHGAPIDVFGHFKKRREHLHSLFKNFHGLRYSAQGASHVAYTNSPPPPWPYFENLWIPIHDHLSLNGRLGYARKTNPQADGDTSCGEIVDADCIVILPGMFGHNAVKRSRDLAMGLRQAGYHVLCLEPRAHGQTEVKYPNMYYTFGVLETDALMQVSDWLERLPHVRRTGLIGYCWSANTALLAAWYDGRPLDDPMIGPTLKPHMTTAPTGQRFAAGIIAFSPVLRWEDLVDALDTPRRFVKQPILAAVQVTVRERMTLKNHPEISGSLRKLIECEYAAYQPSLSACMPDTYTFLRLLPYKDKPIGDKMGSARVPVMIVHGANDPLIPSQDIADWLATIDNPNVAAIILPSGGHVGFAAYAKDYYYSLIANFFDPVTGASQAASQHPPVRKPD